MKSFFLPVGQAAGNALPTIVSALSCGAALPVEGMDILLLTESKEEGYLPALLQDLNGGHGFFPSSFCFAAEHPRLPDLRQLTADAASSALLAALRGEGVPLSYQTDWEAVEWAFSALLAEDGSLPALRQWMDSIEKAGAQEETRVCLMADVCDPFSAGAAFACLRALRPALEKDSTRLDLILIAKRNAPPTEVQQKTMNAALRALAERNLVQSPHQPDAMAEQSPVSAAWLLSLPTALVAGEDSWRLLYVVAARILGRTFGAQKAPATGLHTLELPGILTLQSLGDQARPFAEFLHSAIWLTTDLLPSLHAWQEHPGALRSLSPGGRNGYYRRLFRAETGDGATAERLKTVERGLTALLGETLNLIRSLPEPLRIPEAGDGEWKALEEACGRTVTVASEYDVSLMESEEAGILSVKPVHRVSMADTGEEKQQRRLEDIENQLKEETEKRNQLFREAGGFRAIQALRNCLAQCRDALERAKNRGTELAGAKGVDHLTLVAQARRIRLLEAAVKRCEADLKDEELLRELVEATPAKASVSPFDSRLLLPAAAEKLYALLTGQPEDADSLRKELRAMLPSLFEGYTLSDSKALFRKLTAATRSEEAESPLAAMLGGVCAVSREECEGLRFLSAGNVPPAPLLPDLYPEEAPLTVGDLLPLLRETRKDAVSPEEEAWGLLAMLLLRQYRRPGPEEATLSLAEYDKEASPVLRSYAAARQAEKVWILSMKNKETSLPFALALPGRGLLPAHWTAGHTALLPAFAAPWFDEERECFVNPCGQLCEGDREILRSQLSLMVEKPVHAGLRGLLTRFLQALSAQEEERETPDDQLEIRLKAAFGLRPLPAFTGILERVPVYYEKLLKEDPVAGCLTDNAAFPAFGGDVQEDILYCYRGRPFAREHKKTLLSRIPLPAEAYILNLLSGDCAELAAASDDYHDTLVREISLLLERSPDTLPEARQIAMRLLDQANGALPQEATELCWPWDPQSPAIRTILTEALGPALAPCAAEPFSERLALFPARGGEVLGDALLSGMCMLAQKMPEDSPPDAPVPPADAILPPLSPALTAGICRIPEGRTLLRPGFLAFERTEGGGILVKMTLEGSFTLRLARTYGAEEILSLYAHDLPTLAIWPSLPLPEEDWHAYYTYLHLPAPLQVTAYTAEEEAPLPEEAGRNVTRTGTFPLAFVLRREGVSIGSVPNLLPAPEIRKDRQTAVCIDFGSVGTSVIFSRDGRQKPLQGPTLVRTLLSHPASSGELLRQEFLPALPVSALLPTAARLFRNVPGAAPQPFEDGIVLMASAAQDVLQIPPGALYTCLKWEEEKGRSATVCLHQIMLMAALQARLDGSGELVWRFAIPDEMARPGRERLAELFAALAEEVNRTAGFPTPTRTLPVSFVSESSALGAYFRYCAPEDTRGGFMVLDLGACTADISLYLRGREQAVRTCQLPLGVHYMLLPTLLRQPASLREELGYVQDPGLMQDLALLEETLRRAGSDSAALRQARMALDHFIADRYSFLLPALLYNPATGGPTRTGSVLLLHLCYLMMLSGLLLLQISTDSGKNDFLPEQMSLCMAGRGALLLEGMPDAVKTGCWHFLTMFRNRRVASLNLLFSAEKKMEIPVGLSLAREAGSGTPIPSGTPAALPVRPEELLPQFLLRFAKEFPASSAQLFPGFFTPDFYHPFSPPGEQLVTDTIGRAFTRETALRPFDALAAWPGLLLEMCEMVRYAEPGAPAEG